VISDYYRGALEALKARVEGVFMISPGDIDPPGDSRWTIDQVLGTDYYSVKCSLIDFVSGGKLEHPQNSRSSKR
jgi:hypothetical protein